MTTPVTMTATTTAAMATTAATTGTVPLRARRRPRARVRRSRHVHDAPQIRQNGPGTCPICGMTLELVTMTADIVRNPSSPSCP